MTHNDSQVEVVMALLEEYGALKWGEGVSAGSHDKLSVRRFAAEAKEGLAEIRTALSALAAGKVEATEPAGSYLPEEVKSPGDSVASSSAETKANVIDLLLVKVHQHLGQALRIPTMPWPDPGAHGHEATGRAIHAAYCALRFKVMDAIAELTAARCGITAAVIESSQPEVTSPSPLSADPESAVVGAATLSDDQIEKAALASGLDEELWFGRFTPKGYEDTLPKLRRFADAVRATLPHPALDRANAGERESDGVCLICAANHYCPEHNPEPANRRERISAACAEVFGWNKKPALPAADPERREGAEWVIASGEVKP